MRPLILSTTIRRGDDVLDIAITFRVSSFVAGCPARIRCDENDHPAEPDEFEFEIVRIEIDRPEATDAALTDAEISQLQEWFEDHYGDACEAAYTAEVV